MTKLQKTLIIVLGIGTVFNLVFMDDWRLAALPAAGLLNMWFVTKENQMSRPAKIVAFSGVMALLLVACIPIWHKLSR